MADDPQHGEHDDHPDAPLDDRVSRLETGQHSLAEKVDKVLGILSGDGGRDKDTRHDDEPTGPGSVQEQVRAELERARAEQEAAAAADAEKTEKQQIREQLAKLAEKPPAAPVPRRTRMLGWGD